MADFEVALAAGAANAAPEVAQAHLLLLPTEVITAILEQLAAAGDYLAVCRAASSCVVLRAAASSAWKAAVEAALLPAAWRGAPPSSWQQCARDAFALDGAEWLAFAPRLREPTFAHTAVEHGGAIYVFGGRDAANYSNRVHALELRDGRYEWRHVETTGEAPSPRRAHAAWVWRGRMHILGGGRSGPSGMAAAGQEPPGCHFSLGLHDLRWRPEPPPTDENWRRFGHTATLVPEWPTYTLPGLYRIVPADDDADSLRMDAMQLQDPPEAGAAATPPWRGAAVVVIGGAWQDGPPRPTISAFIDVWRCRLGETLEWDLLEPSGATPATRYRHAAVYVEARQAVLVHGGYVRDAVPADRAVPLPAGGFDAQMLNDGGVYLLQLRTVAWERVTTREPGALIARGGHTMTFVGATKLFIFGGGHMYNAIDNAVFNWHEADLATDARYGVGASNSVVLDTQDWSVSLAWAGRGFDAGTHGTSLKVIGDAPAPRGGHTATLVPHDGKLAILILGGRNYDEEGHAANPHLGRDDAHLLVPRSSM